VEIKNGTTLKSLVRVRMHRLSSKVGQSRVAHSLNSLFLSWALGPAAEEADDRFPRIRASGLLVGAAYRPDLLCCDADNPIARPFVV
jgi:hypothetical protein